MTATPEYGAALIGLVISAILLGMVIMQAGHYFCSYRRDPVWLRLSVVSMCLLDTVHFCFSMHMMYTYLIQNFGNVAAVTNIIWSLKGLVLAQVLLIWLVQYLYLARIWKLSRKIINNPVVSKAIFVGIISTAALAAAVGLLFIVKVFELRNGLSIEAFRWAILMACNVTILIDIVIAVVMFTLLYSSQTGIKRTDGMLFTLMQYVIGTGVVTSLASIVYVVLYIVKPNSFLYLAQEFLIPRLYVNSFLAMMNARDGLREQLDTPVDVEVNLNDALRFSPSASTICPEPVKHAQSRMSRHKPQTSHQRRCQCQSHGSVVIISKPTPRNVSSEMNEGTRATVPSIPAPAATDRDYWYNERS